LPFLLTPFLLRSVLPSFLQAHNTEERGGKLLKDSRKRRFYQSDKRDEPFVIAAGW